MKRTRHRMKNDSDDDIFDYKSLKRFKKAPTVNKNKKGSKTKANTAPSVSKESNKNECSNKKTELLKLDLKENCDKKLRDSSLSIYNGTNSDKDHVCEETSTAFPVVKSEVESCIEDKFKNTPSAVGSKRRSAENLEVRGEQDNSAIKPVIKIFSGECTEAKKSKLKTKQTFHNGMSQKDKIQKTTFSSSVSDCKGAQGIAGKHQTNTQRTPAKRKTPGKQKSVPRPRVKHEGHCPFCQMPFETLVVQSPRWHVTECMDLPLKAIQECPAGLNCDNTIPGHFRKFRHTLLANRRAGMDKDKEQQDNSSASPDDADAAGSKTSDVSYQPETHATHLASGSCPDNIPQSPSRTENLTSCASSSSRDKSESGCVSSLPSTRTNLRRNLFDSTVDEKIISAEEQKEEETLADRVLNNTQGKPVQSQSSPDYLDDSMGEGSDADIFSLCENERTSESSHIKQNGLDCTSSNVPSFSDSGSLASTVSSCRPQPDDKDDDVVDDDNTCRESQDEVKSECDEDLAETDFPETEMHNVKVTGGSDDYINGDTLTSDDLDQLLCPDEELESQAGLNAQLATTNDCSQNDIDTNSGSGSQSQNVQVGTKQTSLLSFFSCASRTKKTQLGGAQPSKTLAPSGAQPSRTGGSAAGGPWSLTRQGTSKTSVPNNRRGQQVQTSESQGAGSTQRSNRRCPFYKKMPGTPFTVDAFRYGSIPGCTAYFLTHFHYDHYGGLTKKFSHPVYCSKITANLVLKKIRMNAKYIHPLPMETPSVVEGVEVTLLEANHCPGAVLLLFKLPDGCIYLHTGDFRADESMERYPALRGVTVDQLYLDTTYCDPAYAFPPQTDVINFAVNLVTDTLYQHPNTLIVCGSYTIGKERIFLAIAEAINSRVAVIRDKKSILDCLESDRVSKIVTLQWREAQVHVLPMGKLSYQNLKGHLEGLKLRFDRVLAFEPTGWTHSNKALGLEHLKPKFKRDNITVYGVPYSEHSSYTEMKRFVQFLRPKKILPTVNNGSPASRKKMERIFQSWQEEAERSPGKVKRQAAINSWVVKSPISK